MSLVGGGEPPEKKGGPFGNNVVFMPPDMFCNKIASLFTNLGLDINVGFSTKVKISQNGKNVILMSSGGKCISIYREKCISLPSDL